VSAERTGALRPAPPTDPTLARYVPPVRRAWRARFWLALLGETLGGRRFSGLVRAWSDRAGPVVTLGQGNLPAAGGFVLALNHFGGAQTTDVLLAVGRVLSEVRPGATDRLFVVSGRRQRRRRSPLAAISRRGVEWFFRRWAASIVRVPLGNPQASSRGLREWRRRLADRSAIVFPEGRAAPYFGRVRAGSGRWLRALGAPTVPVGVWTLDGAWHVRFGPPIDWCADARLADHQLGLNVAALLPADLAPAWQGPLARWRRAHETADCP
jgi:hypothetical protein